MRMLAGVLSVAATLVALSSTAAQAVPGVQVIRPPKPAYRFAGVKWGASAAAIEAAMSTQGLRKSKTKDGDLYFDGMLMGYQAEAIALMNPKGELVKWFIVLLTPDQHAIDAYHDTRDALARIYGDPQQDVELYQDPYEKGDGYETTAIQVGKATIASLWPADGEGTTLLVEISEQLDVDIAYESAAFAAEADRRKAAAASIFGKPPAIR